MPMFSKMMSSYPFQLIRGLGPGIMAGGAVGSMVPGRNDRVGGALRGAAGGAIAYGGVKAYNWAGGVGGMANFGRNMMKPGMAGMYGGAVKNKVAEGVGGLSNLMKRVAGALR